MEHLCQECEARLRPGPGGVVVQVLCSPCRTLNGVKVCCGCRMEKALHAFHRDSRRRGDGHLAKCKACQVKANKSAGGAHYKSAYGITTEDALALKAGGCDVCGTQAKLNIDHCHDSGVVRGVLCHRHNLALGFCRDSAEDLMALAEYAQKHAHLKAA